MANPKITVEIGAVADGLIKNVDGSIRSLEQLQRELDDLDKKLRTAADPTEIIQLNQQIGALKTGMQQLRTVGIQPLTKAQSNYNSVGTDFSRLIQDAPFGIIGVSNNITQLASSFEAARGKGQSFGQILGSIFSSGNLLSLGISAITTALVLYSQSTQGAAKESDLLKDSYDDLADSAENAAKKIAAIRFSDDKIKEEIDRILELDSSFNFITASAEQLTEITNRAFAKLDREQLNAFKSDLGELANDQLRKVGNELELTRTEAIDFIKSLKGNDAAFESLSPKIRESIAGYNRLSSQVNLASDQLDFYSSNSDKTKASIDRSKDSVDSYEDVIAKAVKAWTDFEDAELRAITLARQLDPNQLLQNAAAALTGREGDVAFKNPVIDLQNKIASDLANFNLPDIKAPEFDEASSNLFFDRVDEFKQRASQILESGIEQSIGNFAFAIGEALATGGDVFKALGGAILGGIAMVLDQLGQAAIAAGVGMIAIKEAFKNPGTAIAAGVGLIALAGYIKTKVGKATGSIGGGGGGGSFSGGSGVSQGMSFAGAGVGMQFDRSLQLGGEFRVKGQDLVYVFNEASSKNQRG